MRWKRTVAAWLCAGVLGAQVASQSDEAQMQGLTLDELVAHLPTAGSEWIGDGTQWTIAPAAAELKRRIEQGVERTEEHWKRVLLATGVLALRERWPASEPFAVSMRLPSWLGRVTLAPLDERLAVAQCGFPSWCGNSRSLQTQRWAYQPLGELPLGPHRLAFALTVEGPRNAEEGDEFFFEGEFEFPIEVVASLDEALPPLSGPELEREIGRALGIGFFGTDRLATLVLAPDAGLQDIALVLELELLHEGVVLQTRRLRAEVWKQSLGPAGAHRDSVAFPAVPDLLSRDPGARRGWSLRVRSTDDGVLTQWRARRRWVGAFELPLETLFTREQERNPEGISPWDARYALLPTTGKR